MWTRAQLKDKAKAALKVNYWKMVLVAALISLLVGGTGSASSVSSTDTSNLENEDIFGDEYDGDYDYDIDEEYTYDDIYGSSYDDLEDMMNDASSTVIFLVAFLIGFTVVMVVILGISLVMSAFITNPIEVGCNRFFVKTLEEPAQVKEVAFAFDNSYKNVVKVMFFRTLYTMLWTLLFIIPGIIKSYEYRMIPYLMAENPNLTKEQAFALSKQMMMGQKWSAFVLDLSFIGWHFLSVCTLGLLEVFYVGPYMYATNAALYEELSSAYGHPAQNTYVTAPYQQVGAYEAVNPYEATNPYGEAYSTPVQESDVQETYVEE